MSSARPAGLAEKLNLLMQSMSAYQTQMVDSLVALCRIPSVSGSPAPDAPFGSETAAALKAYLEIGARLGFRPVNLDNRVGYLEYGSGDKLFAILGHLDVVPAGCNWLTDPFEPVVLPDRIIARGAADDKGPMIAALYALKALADEGFRPDGRIRLIVGLDEENNSSCMEYYSEVEELPTAGFTPDACFPVIYAEKGIVWIELDFEGGQKEDAAVRLVAASAGLCPNMVPGSCSLRMIGPGNIAGEMTVTGQPAHASTPWEGKNAIALAMSEVDRRLQAANCSHPFVDFFSETINGSWLGEGLGIAGQDESGPLTLNAGILDLNEHAAHLTLDIRYPVTWKLEKIMTAIEAKASEYGAKVTLVKASPPLHMAQDSRLVAVLMETYRDLTGLAASPVAIGGGTYARAIPNIVAFGPFFPGDVETAHQPGEYITLETLLASAAIFRQALINLLK